MDNLEVGQLFAFEFQNGLCKLTAKDDFQTALKPKHLALSIKNTVPKGKGHEVFAMINRFGEE